MQRTYPRFQKASRPDRQRILDEFCVKCSCHRKHADPLAEPLAMRNRVIRYGITRLGFTAVALETA
ncbi:MAG TPA: hypothetical protein VG206_14880 [Terriglobia bacterium]|nr:hypothetical protein [Terriglobia bacterium]